MRASLLLLSLVLVGCKVTPGNVRLPNPFRQSGVAVSPSYVLATPQYYQGVAGKAENITNKDLHDVHISFVAEDWQGGRIATAEAQKDVLKAGEVWKFRAKFKQGWLPRLDSITKPRVEVFGAPLPAN